MVSVKESLSPVVSRSSLIVPLPITESSPKKDIRLEAGPYVARLALTEAERAATYRLRFVVFNLEMNEGLESAFADGYHKDRYDDVCDHLILEERTTCAILGTY